jgi:hypothetical protein
MSKGTFYHYLELEIEQIISELDKDVRNKAIFRSVTDGEMGIWATCNYLTEPPIISVNINSLEEAIRPQIKKQIAEILNHELIHAIQARHNIPVVKEKEAYHKQDKVNFKKKMNLGTIEEGVYIKYVSFNKAVLWKDRQISIHKDIAENWLPSVKKVRFIDRAKGMTWEAPLEKIKECWILKKEGQEEQYYIPIEVFSKKTKQETEDEKMKEFSKQCL